MRRKNAQPASAETAALGNGRSSGFWVRYRFPVAAMVIFVSLSLLAVWFNFEASRSQTLTYTGAAIVLVSESGEDLEVVLPFPVGQMNGTYFVDPESGWFAVLAEKYPSPANTSSSVELLDDGVPSLRLRTNGTLVVGIEWHARDAADAFPFSSSTEPPDSLSCEAPLNPGSALIVSFMQNSGWTVGNQVRYVITSTTGTGPAGILDENVRWPSELVSAAELISVRATCNLPLHAGAFQVAD